MTKLVNINEWLASSNYAYRLKATATIEGWEHSYNGVAVTEQMANFLTEVSKAMPKLKFIPYDDAYVSTSNGSVRVICLFLAYMDDYPYDIGRVGYGKFAVKGDAESFAVYSRKIQNAKYAEHRDQHHMIMSKDVSKAVSNAKKYITPYTTKELAIAMYEPIQNKTSSVLNQAQRSMLNVIDPLVQGHTRKIVIAEMLNLMTQNVQFVTKEFKDIVINLKDKVDACSEEEKKKVNGLFVRVYTIGNDPYVDVQVADNIRTEMWGHRAITGSATTYAMSELPEDIAHSIAALNILNHGQYVDNLGMKVDDKHFWVEKQA